MNTRRSVRYSLPALRLLAFSATVTGQEPSLPTLARLDALTLNAIAHGVYAKAASMELSDITGFYSPSYHWRTAAHPSPSVCRNAPAEKRYKAN